MPADQHCISEIERERAYPGGSTSCQILETTCHVGLQLPCYRTPHRLHSHPLPPWKHRYTPHVCRIFAALSTYESVSATCREIVGCLAPTSSLYASGERFALVLSRGQGKPATFVLELTRIKHQLGERASRTRTSSATLPHRLGECAWGSMISFSTLASCRNPELDILPTRRQVLCILTRIEVRFVSLLGATQHKSFVTLPFSHSVLGHP